MKLSHSAVALLLLTVGAAQAQDIMPSAVGAADYIVSERGPGHRVWQKVVPITDKSGKITLRTNVAYIELASGLNYLDNGQWKESREDIEVVADGAAARYGAHKVHFAKSPLTRGAVQLEMVDGKKLRSHVIGLAYKDMATGESVLIAEVKDSIGTIVGRNQVVYEDAFTGFRADLRYTYTRAGFEQDVILRESLPGPEDYGLNSKTTRLLVLTEFLSPPIPRKKTASERQHGGAAVVDEELDFGPMRIGRGKAFSVGAENPTRFPVTKQWLKLEGRDFLVEEVGLDSLAVELQKLPKRQGASIKPKKNSTGQIGARQLRLPATPRKEAVQSKEPMRIAQANGTSPGVVLDYVIINANQDDFTFQGDTTYYVSGAINFGGTTTFEGGTVVKSVGNLNLGVIKCLTSPYRPAVFTSKDDNSVGEPILGSTGAPTSNAGGLDISPTGETTLENFRLSYSSYTCVTYYVPTVTNVLNLRNVVIQHCGEGMYIDTATGDLCPFDLRNVLLSDVVSPFAGYYYSGRGEHVTVVNCSTLASSDGNTIPLNFTNSVFVNVPTIGFGFVLDGQNNGFYNSITFGSAQYTNTTWPFQTAGGGSYYLTNGCTFRDAGTVNIHAGLLSEVRKKTTYPPVVFSNVVFNVSTNFGLQAGRDTNTLDLGYHYDPLDYVFGGVTVNNNITFLHGAAAAWFMTASNNTGILMGDSDPGHVIAYKGLADDPCWFVSFNTVQEGLNNGWTSAGWAAIGLYDDYNYPGPVLNAQFTKWSMPAGTSLFFGQPYGDESIADLGNCEFYSGQIDAFGWFPIFVKNSLLWRVNTTVRNFDYDDTTFEFRNCLFWNGYFSIHVFDVEGHPWIIQDTAFDSTVISINNETATPINCDYNAFLDGADQLTPSGNNDVIVSGSFNWQDGRLGNFYLPGNSTLINVGSQTADQTGLYHFTTQTNQTKEGNSQVDIGYHYVAIGTNGLPADSDLDGVPDYVEDANGNGVVDVGETEWNDYFGGVTPTLTIISGNTQTNMPDTLLPVPLTVRLTKSGGVAAPNFSIVFAVTQGGAQIAIASNGTYASSQNLLTDANGDAAVFMKLPSTLGTTIAATATFNNGTYNVQVTFSEYTMSGAKLWLRADAGITNTSVNRWMDQSGNGFDGTQNTAANRAVLVSGALNGKPVVRFDGTNDSLTFGNLLNGTTQAEAFVVLKAAADAPVTDKSLWFMGAPNSGNRYPATDGTITEGFATSVNRNIGNPTSPLDQYHLFNVAGGANYWHARINGLLQNQVSVNTYAFTTTPSLGFGQSLFFAGDIAEVLIFNRVLGNGERDQVARYLNAKYALVPPPLAPATLAATAISPSQISLTWAFAATNASTSFQIERKTGAGGTYATVATVTDTTSYVDTNLLSSTQYYYRVKAVNIGGESGYSNEAAATTLSTGAAAPLGDLRLWVAADGPLVRQGGNNSVRTWTDQSGNANDGTQATIANQPVWIDNALNSRPVLRFDGTNDSFPLPNLLNGTTQAEVFVVLKAAADVPATDKSLWFFGAGNSGGRYPAVDGTINEGFGTSSLRNIGNPTQPLDQYHLFNVAGAANLWSARINGLLQSAASVNTYTFTTTPHLGYGLSLFFAGDMAEVLVFSRVLTTAERDTVQNYLSLKYALCPAPATPTNLLATAVSSNQISLTWDLDLTTTSTRFQIERKTGAGGTYALVAEVRDTLSYIDTNLLPGTQYYYRVKAANVVGESSFSNEATATTSSGGTAMPLADLRLWVKGDGTLVRQGANNSVRTWLDHSGNGNDGSQATIANQPLWISGVLNNRPVVRFDGTNDSVALPNLLAGTTQAEAFVVLKAAADVPATDKSLWFFGAGNSGGRYPAVDGTINEGFGTSALRNIGNPTQPLDQYHLFNVAGAANYWSARVNGIAQTEVFANTYTFSTTPYLGYGLSLFFAGDMAEVLVFSRVLTPAERDTVEGYLGLKYGLGTPPATPTNLVASAVSSNQISLTWGFDLTTIATRFQVERKTGAGGTYALVMEVRNATSYVDTNLVAGTEYYYRVKAVNFSGESGYSNEANATTSGSGVELPLANLKLWLKADAVLRQSSTNSVGTWLDQTINRFDGTQTAFNSRPRWIDHALNDRPVVRFDAIDDNFTLPNLLTGTTQAETFVVLKATADVPAGSRQLWVLGGVSSGTAAYPNTLGNIVEEFGTTTARTVGDPAQPLNQYHMYNVAGQGGFWGAWINGMLQLSANANTYGFWSTPRLGFGNNVYFGGDIAEVLIFNKVLSTAERDAVGSYLSFKYALAAAPAAPTNLVATALSSNQVNLTWNSEATTVSTRFQVERKTGVAGTYAAIAEVRDATSYFDATLAAGTQYYYRVKAVNFAGESIYSNQANATTSAGGVTLPLANLRVWLKADAVLRQNSTNTVRTWFDQTTNRNDGTQTAFGNQPRWLDHTLNDRPVVRFDGIDDNFTLPNLLNGTTQAEVFVVLKATVDVPAAQKQLWVLGGVSSGSGSYPNTSGNIVEEFGSTTARTVGNPAQPLDQYHLYNVSAQAGFWGAWVNGVVQFSTAANTYGFWSTPRLGFGNNVYFAGDIAELLIFSQVLTGAQRDSVNSYLNSKYALVASVPAAPVNLTATAISPTQINLAWSNVTAVAGIQIERKAGSGGTFAVIATLGASVTTYSDIGLPSGQIYFYRVRASNLAGVSPYSNEASAAANNNPTVALTEPTNNATFTRPVNITLAATAADVDGTVSLVEFFYGTTKIGEDSAAPYTIVWNNPPTGVHSLTARATDNLGGTNTSAAVSVTVSNRNPDVAMTAPADNSLYQEGGTVNLAATASDLDGTVSKVQFFRGGSTLIGEDTTAPYTFAWTNVPDGTFSITAVATDNDNGTTTSSAITVIVNNAPTVSITSPAPDAVFDAVANITINANASDTDGTISRVDFYSGLNFIGSDSSSPYSFAWNNVTAGTYQLKAVAFDNAGGSGASATVRIEVRSNLVAIADAHVRAGNQAANNFGTSTNVEVETTTANNTRWGYFKFSVPSGLSNVVGVRFRFNAKVSAAATIGTTLYAVSSTNWIESGGGGITWNTKPAASTSLGSASVNTTGFTSYEIDVTSHVLAQLAAGSNVISLALTNPATTSDLIQINSREVSVAGNRPILSFTVTNFFPEVGIVSPANGAFFSPPADIPITAQATSPGGSITQVQFFSGTTSLGLVTSAPYSLTWSNVASGTYNLTARATDSRGLMATSTVVTVYVDASPSVSLTSPANGATFVSPANITLAATASDSDGTIANVEFFQGTTSLGSDASSPYSVNWNSVPGGNYALTARATDNLGLVSTSSVANITVFSPPAITVQPQSQITFVGANVTLGVTATGTAPLNYQWTFNGTNLAGQASSVLSLPNAQQSSSGIYTVVVSNAYGSVTSAPASLVLTVIAAWGTNTSGQATLHPWMTNNIVSISAGSAFNVALRTDGTVTNWGAAFGAPPAGLSDVVAISAGGGHTLALRGDRTLIAWGSNDAGQTNIPASATNIVAISAGGRHNLALKMDGTVVGWGTGNGGSESNVPAGLNGVRAIAAGIFNSMVLKSNGTVLVWGANCCGQTNVPGGLSDVMAIASGNQYQLVLHSNGIVQGWGFERNGQLAAPGSYVTIAAGYRHALGITSGGTVDAWGGQPDPFAPPFLTDPYGGQADVPAGLGNVIGVRGGDFHSIALIANNTNLAPNVYLTSPTNNTALTNAAVINLTATASDWDGTVAQVDFYVNGELIGSDTNSPYSVAWNNPAPGVYSLTAKATDNAGATKTSKEVAITIVSSLAAQADAHVKLSNPATNFGTTNLLELQLGTTGTNVGYLRFNLSNAPVVTSAKLRLSAKINGSGSVGTTVFGVSNTNWIESGAGSITWSNRPALGSALTNITVSGTSSIYYEVDITAYIKSELLAGKSLISLALSNTVVNSTRLIQINSRENASNPPQLVLGNTNKLPTVSITSPANNTVFLSPANITIDAVAADADGTITKVEFFAGANKIGEDTNAPYSLNWLNVTGGAYTLTAVATDNSGGRRTSAPVIVNVNMAPVVTLTSPTNNAEFLEPASVALTATASDPDGSVVKVEFYAGANKVAESTGPVFSVTWTNAAAGSYVITAKATDNLGSVTVSAGSNIVVYALSSGGGFRERLGYWRSETTNWLGEAGQVPKFFTNIQNITLSSSNHALQVDSASPANLKYRDVEDNHRPNIELQTGTVVFRFKPNWKSANAGGAGPGAFARLISVGQWTSDASYGSWNLSVSADGNQIFFVTQTNGVGVTNLVVPVSLVSNTWYQLALTYTPASSSFYFDAVQVGTNGVGVVYYPGALVRALDGFSIGSNRAGNEQARGQFDELETFNYALDAAQLAQRPDTDSDGLPDGWENQYGLNPYDNTGPNGASGDPDGDGLTNIEEWYFGTNPQVSNAASIGTGLINIHTPLE